MWSALVNTSALHGMRWAGVPIAIAGVLLGFLSAWLVNRMHAKWPRGSFFLAFAIMVGGAFGLAALSVYLR